MNRGAVFIAPHLKSNEIMEETEKNIDKADMRNRIQEYLFVVVSAYAQSVQGSGCGFDRYAYAGRTEKKDLYLLWNRKTGSVINNNNDVMSVKK